MYNTETVCVRYKISGGGMISPAILREPEQSRTQLGRWGCFPRKISHRSLLLLFCPKEGSKDNTFWVFPL